MSIPRQVIKPIRETNSRLFVAIEDTVLDIIMIEEAFCASRISCLFFLHGKGSWIRTRVITAITSRGERDAAEHEGTPQLD
jgi:hypothetical protein